MSAGWEIAARERKVTNLVQVIDAQARRHKLTDRQVLTSLAQWTDEDWYVAAQQASKVYGRNHGLPSQDTRDLVIARIEGRALADAFQSIEREAKKIRGDMGRMGART